MSVTFQNAGAAVVTGSTNLTPFHPSSPSNGDLFLLVVANKYPPNDPDTPSGWTLEGVHSAGSGASGADSGECFISVYSKISDGTETGTINIDIPSGHVGVSNTYRISKSEANPFRIDVVAGEFETPNSTAWSATASSGLDSQDGDLWFVASASNSDVGTFSSELLTQDGTTFASHTERQDSSTSTGDDIRFIVSTHPVTTGGGNGAPVYTMTAAASITNGPCGPTLFVRISDNLAPEPPAEDSTYVPPYRGQREVSRTYR